MYTRKWTEQEQLDLLQLLEEGKSDEDIAAILNRSLEAVRLRRCRSGINSRWSEREDQILHDGAGKYAYQIADLLPSRTVSAIVGRRNFLGIVTKPRWTQDEEQVLRDNLDLTDRELGTMVNRKPTAVRGKRLRMGLKKRGKRMWADDEIEYLVEYRPLFTFADIGHALGRSPASVSGKWGAMMRKGEIQHTR